MASRRAGLPLKFQVILFLLPFVQAVRAAREARGELAESLDVEHELLQTRSHSKHLQLSRMQQASHWMNVAAEGELVLLQVLTGQELPQDTSGTSQQDISRTLEVYRLDSWDKLQEALKTAVDPECLGGLTLDDSHRCHKAFPIYDVALTIPILLIVTSVMMCLCFGWECYAECCCCCCCRNKGIKT
mmetsp:Transcript_17240/g.30232  ORF Transcript_17240/g.30232 Transcript_17240/m.30232 type:complete len:187 (+) Transcript_17240:75-635(+)